MQTQIWCYQKKELALSIWLLVASLMSLLLRLSLWFYDMAATQMLGTLSRTFLDKSHSFYNTHCDVVAWLNDALIFLSVWLICVTVCYCSFIHLEIYNLKEKSGKQYRFVLKINLCYRLIKQWSLLLFNLNYDILLQSSCIRLTVRTLIIKIISPPVINFSLRLFYHTKVMVNCQVAFFLYLTLIFGLIHLTTQQQCKKLLFLQYLSFELLL